jgi:preprotein translocase subunit SecY
VKKLIQTLKNIWTIEELRDKIILTLALVLTYRLGNHIVLPGMDPNKIEQAQQTASNTGLLGIFDMFAGGGFSQASILALGIMPYIYFHAAHDHPGSNTAENSERWRQRKKENQ